MLDFCRAHLQQDWHAADLVSWVQRHHAGPISPGSPDRVLRALAAEGRVSYEVINRRQSLYRITDVCLL